MNEQDNDILSDQLLAAMLAGDEQQDFESSSSEEAPVPPGCIRMYGEIYPLEEMLKKEMSLSVKERRKRYRCGDAFVTADEMPSLKMIYERELASLQKSMEEEEEGFLDGSNDNVESVYDANDEINSKVCTIRGDITTFELDAIVNAANRGLMGGGGIDGAIHRAAGRNLRVECYTLNGAETGETKKTLGWNLPSKYILHTVGPVGEGSAELRSCYQTILDIVGKSDDIRTIALCGISTGIYGFPLVPATKIAMATVRDWLEDESNRAKVDKIVFCTFLEREVVCYNHLFKVYFPPVLNSAQP